MALDFEVNYLYFVVLCFIFRFHAVSQSLNHRLSITRGYQDRFTNPRCTTRESCSCNNLEAHCHDHGCSVCQCDSQYQTFLPGQGANGKCVKNDKLVFSVGTNHSFLVYQESNNVCLRLLTPHWSPIYVVATTCDPTSYKQRWIWTQNKQLLNEYSLKCLEMSNEYLLPNENRYPLLVLNFCNATNARQLWQCQGKKKNLFFLRYDQRFLRFRLISRLYVYLFRGRGKYSSWRRYGRSDQSLCSQISSYNGCYRYSDGSSMIVIGVMDFKTCKFNGSRCIKEKDVEAPIEATNHQCSIQWKMSQFLNYSVWELLPFKEEIFTIVKKNRGLTLKVNLTKASNKWQGQIIRLYIRCVDGRLNQTGETHCVLIKFSGSFKTLYQAYSKKSTPLTTKPAVLTSDVPESTKSNENVTQPNQEKTQSGDKSLAIIIVICLLLVFSITGSIIAYLFYKRKRCFDGQNSGVTKDADGDDATTSLSADQGGAETQNPLYSTEDNFFLHTTRKTSTIYQEPEAGAASQCELYETDENHVYYSIQDDTNKEQPRLQEDIYNYATSDNMSQRPLPTDQVQRNSDQTQHETDSIKLAKTKQTKVGPKNGEAEKAPLYHVLE